MTDAIVIGAGAGGLVAAWQLASGGARVLVLEAWKWAGGLLGRAEVAGLSLDVGAEGYSVRGGGVAQLLADLGADDLIERPEPVGAWLQTATGAHPIPKGLYFGLPADPTAADVRAVVGDVPAAQAPQGATMADWARAAYGQRVVDDLVTPLVGGVYSTTPEEVRLADLAPTTAALVEAGTPLREAVARSVAPPPPGGAVNGIRGGMHALVDRLVSATTPGSVEVRCGQPVSRVERTSGGWQVTTPAGTERAPLLVIALPLDAAAALLGGPAPEAQPAALDVITLVLDDDLADAPRGTGVLVAANVPGVAAKAMTHSTAKWAWLRAAAGGRDVLRLSYGRRGLAPVTSVLDPAELTALVRADASALLDRPIGEPLAVRRTGWRTLPPGTPGVAASRDWLTAQAGDDLALVGAGIAGVGLAAVVPHARAEAARLLKKQEN